MDFSDLTKQSKRNDVGISYFGGSRVVYPELNNMAIYLLRHYLGCRPAPDPPSSLIPRYHPCNTAPPRMHQALSRPSAFAYAVSSSWADVSYSTFKDQLKYHLPFEVPPLLSPAPRQSEHLSPRLWAHQGQDNGSPSTHASGALILPMLHAGDLVQTPVTGTESQPQNTQ